MAHPLKVLTDLSREELDQLEAYCRERMRTVDEVHTWLQSHGFTMGRNAAWNWKKAFEQQQIAERTSEAAGLANAFTEAMQKEGGLGIPAAAAMQLSQLVFELATVRGQDADTVNKLSLAAQRLSLAMNRIEKTRNEMEKREHAAIEEASKVVQAGGSGENAVDKVREILGLGAKKQ